MSKVVVSIWFVHIFGLEKVSGNDWYKCNKNWNVCPKRNGTKYNQLKNAFHQDLLKIVSSFDKDVVIKSIKHLDGLWEKIPLEFPKYFKQVVQMSCLINERMEQDLSKTTANKSFVERSQEFMSVLTQQRNRTESNQSQEHQKIRNNSICLKRKWPQIIKNQRYSAEKNGGMNIIKTWNYS